MISFMSAEAQERCKPILDEALELVFGIFLKNNVTLFEAARLSFMLEINLSNIIKKQEREVLEHSVLKEVSLWQS